jgi:D-alanyl-D-alanine endopeptidase (penicillin-binding protein 7)
MAIRVKAVAQAVGTLFLVASLGVPVAQATSAHKVAKPSKTHAAKKPTGRMAVVAVKHRQSRKIVANVAARSRASGPRIAAVARPFYGQQAGLNATSDDLGLKSNAVMVIDQDTHKVLFNKNASAVLPIASLTKLMTALVITDAALPMDESITITEDDVDTLKNSGSRLAVGTTLTRGELLHLALMSSENRAAHSLGRTFPGGLGRFVEAMNVKAKLLGMLNTQYVDPTGLSPHNQSSAKDLATLVSVAHDRPILRELSTSPSYEVASGNRTLHYRNTNQLVNNPNWDIGLQKTGYITEAGRCLVMQAKVAGRQMIMVFLDSAGKLTRIADAERVRHWLEAQPASLL